MDNEQKLKILENELLKVKQDMQKQTVPKNEIIPVQTESTLSSAVNLNERITQAPKTEIAHVEIKIKTKKPKEQKGSKEKSIKEKPNGIKKQKKKEEKQVPVE